MRPVLSVPLLGAAVLTAGAVAVRILRAPGPPAALPGDPLALPSGSDTPAASTSPMPSSLPDRLRARGF